MHPLLAPSFFDKQCNGDALFNIATFDKTAKVSKSIEQFDDKFDYEGR